MANNTDDKSPEAGLAKINKLADQLQAETAAAASVPGARSMRLGTYTDDERRADDEKWSADELARIDAALAGREVPAGTAPPTQFDPMNALVDLLHGINETAAAFASSQPTSPAARAFSRLAAIARAHLELAGEVVPVINAGAPKPSPYARPPARVLGARGPGVVKRVGPVTRVAPRQAPLRLPPRPNAPPIPIVRLTAAQRQRRDLRPKAPYPGAPRPAVATPPKVGGK